MHYNTGIVKLCMRSGEVVAEKKYDSVFVRKYEMMVWAKHYGPAFLHCHYLICPDTDIEAIDIMGGNIRKGPNRKRVFESVDKPVNKRERPDIKIPLIRPPAIYDNKNFL